MRVAVVAVRLVVERDLVDAVEHGEQRRAVEQQRAVDLESLLGQHVDHGAQIGPPCGRVVVRVHQVAVRVAGADEVRPQVDAVRVAVEQLEGELGELEPVAQRPDVVEQRVHVVRGRAVVEDRRAVHLDVAGVVALGVEHRRVAEPLALDGLLPLAGRGLAVPARCGGSLMTPPPSVPAPASSVRVDSDCSAPTSRSTFAHTRSTSGLKMAARLASSRASSSSVLDVGHERLGDAGLEQREPLLTIGVDGRHDGPEGRLVAVVGQHPLAHQRPLTRRQVGRGEPAAGQRLGADLGERAVAVVHVAQV